jgi:hypothetical protein
MCPCPSVCLAMRSEWLHAHHASDWLYQSSDMEEHQVKVAAYYGAAAFSLRNFFFSALRDAAVLQALNLTQCELVGKLWGALPFRSSFLSVCPSSVGSVHLSVYLFCTFDYPSVCPFQLCQSLALSTCFFCFLSSSPLSRAFACSSEQQLSDLTPLVNPSGCRARRSARPSIFPSIEQWIYPAECLFGGEAALRLTGSDCLEARRQTPNPKPANPQSRGPGHSLLKRIGCVWSYLGLATGRLDPATLAATDRILSSAMAVPRA